MLCACVLLQEMIVNAYHTVSKGPGDQDSADGTKAFGSEVERARTCYACNFRDNLTTAPSSTATNYVLNTVENLNLKVLGNKESSPGPCDQERK